MKLHVGVYKSMDNMVTFFPENQEEYELCLQMVNRLWVGEGRVIINNEAVDRDRIIINRSMKGE